MALQVWLPLNGEVKNKGVANVTNTVTTGVINNNGKFGKCYACTSSNYVAVNYTIPTTNTFTIAYWVKFPSSMKDSGSWHTIFSFAANDGTDRTVSSSWTDYNNIKIWDTQNHQHCWMGIDYDVWFHLTITNRFSGDTNYITVYKNGEKVGEYTKNIELKIRSGVLNIGSGIKPANGPLYFNDFRIYDTCLNNIDAKELYWGKIFELTPQWKHNDGLSVIGDASGIGPLTQQTVGDVSLSGNSMYFNGTTGSNITFEGINTVEGTLSVWFNFSTNPGTGILFLDPVSKMCVGYYNSSYLITSTINQSIYSSTAATANRWNHVAITYNSGKSTDGVWINGVQQTATSTQNYWSAAGTLAAVGLRVRSGAYEYPYKGYINEIKAFSSKLTATDIKTIYDKGPNTNDWTSSEPVWLRILHHNAPATNLFTQANCKDNDEENLFSKLKVLFDNDNFRRADGNYEFMVKERLEATSDEQTYRWTQTSNPTASTCTGYNLISQTNNPNRSFGLSFGPTGNCIFSNKNAWWCATGCWTAYQGGIPGFNNVVKTGYMDLYVRADKGDVPGEYVKIEYVESTGNSYFNTERKFNLETDSCKVIFKGNDTANNGMIFASSGGKYFWFYYYSSNGIRVYADNGNGQQGIAGITSDLNKHTMEWKGKHYYIDGVDKGTMSNTYTETTNNIWLFNYGGGYTFKGRIYYVDMSRNSICYGKFIPVKRRSDSVAGMYDIINRKFYTSSGTAFVAGPEI